MVKKTLQKKLKLLAELCGIESNLTSYVSRHSFATQAMLQQVPLNAISTMLGHSSLKTTEVYLKSLPNNILDDYNLRVLDSHKNITGGTGRKGSYWNNAVAERFFKTLKTGLAYHHRYLTRREAELSVFGYIETFHNTKRRHVQLGNLTILEYHQPWNNNIKNAA